MLGALVRKRFGGNDNTNTGGITVTSDKQDPKKPYEVSPKHEGCWLVILSMRVKITISSMCLNLRFAPQRLNQVGNPSPESNPFRLVMWLVGWMDWFGVYLLFDLCCFPSEGRFILFIINGEYRIFFTICLVQGMFNMVMMLPHEEEYLFTCTCDTITYPTVLPYSVGFASASLTTIIWFRLVSSVQSNFKNKNSYFRSDIQLTHQF